MQQVEKNISDNFRSSYSGSGKTGHLDGLAVLVAGEENSEVSLCSNEQIELEPTYMYEEIQENELCAIHIGRLWDENTEWLDTELVVKFDGKYINTYVRLSDASDEDENLVFVAIDLRLVESIKEELDIQLLRKNIHLSRWCYKKAGAGVILSGYIDLDAVSAL